MTRFNIVKRLCLAAVLIIQTARQALPQTVIEWRDTETLMTKAKLEGVEHYAIVDTGASAFIVTESLSQKIVVGRTWETVTIRTLTGGRIGREFSNTLIEANGFPSQRGRAITCPDRELYRLSHVYGRDIQFLVGMSLLRAKVLSFNNERAELSESVPQSSGLQREHPVSFLNVRSPEMSLHYSWTERHLVYCGYRM